MLRVCCCLGKPLPLGVAEPRPRDFLLYTRVSVLAPGQGGARRHRGNGEIDWWLLACFSSYTKNISVTSSLS